MKLKHRIQMVLKAVRFLWRTSKSFDQEVNVTIKMAHLNGLGYRIHTITCYSEGVAEPKQCR